MAEHGFSDRLYRSVFARLVVIMVALAASLLLVVTGFFWFIAGRYQDHARVAPTDRAHVLLAALVLLVMAAALFAAHGLIRRLLDPLRRLSDGVARLSEGQLDVTLPSPGRDEFGTLTAAFNTMVARVRGQIQARDQLLQQIEKLTQLVHQAQQELRAIILHLRPFALEGEPLKKALAALLTDIQARNPQLEIKHTISLKQELQPEIEEQLEPRFFAKHFWFCPAMFVIRNKTLEP